MKAGYSAVMTVDVRGNRHVAIIDRGSYASFRLFFAAVTNCSPKLPVSMKKVHADTPIFARIAYNVSSESVWLRHWEMQFVLKIANRVVE